MKILCTFSLFLILLSAPLMAASSVPEASLKNPDGTSTTLVKAVGDTPTILVFFRGSWCPYCVKHLKEIQSQYDTIKAKGYQVIAISPDRPAKAAEMANRFKLPFKVLSDSSMALSKAFELQFTVNEETRELYKGYNIDLEEASGMNHYMLPHPAVYIIQDGKVTFKHVNPDYRVRLSTQDILKQIGAR